MSGRPTFTFLLCAFSAVLPSLRSTAQGDSEEIRRRFLKSRDEQVQSSTAQPPPNRPPPPPVTAAKVKENKPKDTKPKPKPKPYPLPKKPSPGPHSKAVPTTAPAKGTAPTPAPTPNPAPPPTPAPTPNSAQPPVVVPPAKEKPSVPASANLGSKAEPTPVVVEKSGYDSKPNYQPSSFFGWFSKWKYVTKSLREEIDRAPVQKARWRYIVVHNSGTRQGNAKAFDFYHTKVRKMSNGLAYHFVIGNGTSSGDGQIEVGNRWKKQINGGHVHSDYLNNIALGICLVGDFNQEKPTARQLESLDELIRYLRQRTGKIDGKWAVVKAHKDINPPKWPTDCPGGDFPYAWLRNRFE